MTNDNGTAFDANNASYVSAQSKMALLSNYYRWTYSTLRPYLRGTVVELAAGAGFGIEAYISQAEEVIAVDHDAALLEILQGRLPNVKTLAVDLTGDWSELADANADAMVMMDVIEHFEDDTTFLQKVFSKLKPGGYALIKVPAQQSLYSEMDVASGHYRRYEPSMLQSIAKSAGFEVKTIKGINVLGALAYKRKRNHKSNFSKTFKSGQLKLINRLIPMLAVADNFMPGSGLSLIAVLRRPT